MGMNQGNWGAFLNAVPQGAEEEQKLERNNLQNRYEKDQFVDPASRGNQADSENFNNEIQSTNKQYGTNYAPWQSQGMLFDPVRKGLKDIWTSTKTKLSSFLPGQGQHAMGPAAQATVPGQSNVAASPPGPDTSGPDQNGVPGVGATPFYGDGGAIPPRNAGALRSRKPKPGNIAKPTKAARGAMNPQLEQPVSPPRNTEPSPSNQDPMLADGGQPKLNIKKAIKHPGALHEDLGVPQGQKIPKGKLDAAAHQPGKVGERARFAETLSKFSNGGAVVPKMKPFPAEGNPKPQPNALEKDVSNDGQRNRLGKTIKRFADGGDPPTSPPAQDSGWPGLIPAIKNSVDFYSKNVGEPFLDTALKINRTVGDAGERFLLGPSSAAPAPPAKPATPAAIPPRDAAPAQEQGPPRPGYNPPDTGDGPVEGSIGGKKIVGYDKSDPNQLKLKLEDGSTVPIESEPAVGPPGRARVAAGTPPNGAPPEEQGPATEAQPHDFAQMPVDHQQLPQVGAHEWDQMKASIIHSMAAHGIPLGTAQIQADDQVSSYQHQNFMQYMQQAIALDRQGDKQGAMASLKTAHNYMPNGHEMHFGLDGQGNIVGQGVDESTGKPRGVPVILNQQTMNGLVSTFQDPKAFTNEALAMRQQALHEKEVLQGQIPMQRAAGQKDIAQAGFYTNRNDTMTEIATIRAAAAGQSRLPPQTQKFYAQQLNGAIIDPRDQGEALGVAEILEKRYGNSPEAQGKIVGLLKQMYSLPPEMRSAFAAQSNIPLPGTAMTPDPMITATYGGSYGGYGPGAGGYGVPPR